MYLLAAGKTFANQDGYLQCQGGPPMALTILPKYTVPIALIAGVSAGGIILLVAVIAFIVRRKQRQNRSRKIANLAPLDQGE